MLEPLFNSYFLMESHFLEFHGNFIKLKFVIKHFKLFDFMGDYHIFTRYLLAEKEEGNTMTMREICSKVAMKTPEQRQSGVLIVNFDQVSHDVVLLALCLTLSRFLTLL